ncbi:GntR family transcriptional regulator [Aegicerativicinus sediminis]|uniref:GntR family transcriptional regulator n=1 Tax=Aegicerativicinus sediminis TaxID=2893202 RepID=UPI001E485634|nr:GntR family transcriptional regulator [Aegicerativicinus sediminis]
MKHIYVENQAGQPKYKQIVKSIEESLLNGSLRKGDKLPSINEVRDRFSLSRDTVLMAFNELKMRGIIESFSGKGYYVRSLDTDISQKIFVLFDELNAFKEDLYNAFLKSFSRDVEVDIYFHHFNIKVFEKLINESIGNYHYYVIMPANLKETCEIIRNLPNDRVYILDQFPEELKVYPSVFQDFENDTFNSLSQLHVRLKKYSQLHLIFSEEKQPQGMLRGFKKFENYTDIPLHIHYSTEDVSVKSGHAYLVIDDRDLFKLLKLAKDSGLKIGKEIGIISYNDTLYKELIEGGITTITTDFSEMGKTLAHMIKSNSKEKVINPNTLKIRNSL